MHRNILRLLSLALTLAISFDSTAATHDGKLVAELQANHNVNDCFYFRLEGVGEADPVKASDPGFAVRRDQPGATDAYAMLLAARITSTPVKVVTTGTMVCGYASATFVYL